MEIEVHQDQENFGRLINQLKKRMLECKVTLGDSLELSLYEFASKEITIEDAVELRFCTFSEQEKKKRLPKLIAALGDCEAHLAKIFH